MLGSLRIMLFGFYGVGEYCDDYMADAAKKTFEEVSARHIQWVSPKEPADLIILGGGSLLGTNTYFDELQSIIKRNDCPFAIFGTGVRDIEKGDFLPGLQELWRRAASISVRGETSRRRLYEWGLNIRKIGALGDPIFLTKPLLLESKNYIGGVVRPTFVEDSAWMKTVLDWLHTTRQQPVKLFSFCQQQHDDLGNQATGYESLVLDADATRRGIAESSFWFGNRLHAFCLALIEGIPAIGVEIEFQKVQDVCSTLSYPGFMKHIDYPLSFHVRLHEILMNDWYETQWRLKGKIAEICHNLIGQAQEILGLVK